MKLKHNKGNVFFLALIILFSAVAEDLNAAGRMNLRDCLSLAIDNFPLKKQIALNNRITSLNIGNLNARCLPEINFIGQAQYQSDVTKVSINVPIPGFEMNIPSPSKDQYKAGFNVNQLIWDWGVVSSQKSVENAQLELNNQNIEVELYKLRQHAADLFFGILIIDKKLESLELLKSELQQKLDNITVKVENGVLLESSADILKAEILKASQNIVELQSSRTAGIHSLSELTGSLVADDTEFVLPDIDFRYYEDSLWQRPEYISYTKSQKLLSQMEDLNERKYMPKFTAFAQAMYARPGLNMFEPDFAAYYIFGFKATWNFWNWNTPSREYEILETQKKSFEVQKESFTRNLKISTVKLLQDIDKTNLLIEKDKEIVALRTKISGQAAIQLENGVITATEYITEINSASQAKLSLECRKIELVQAEFNYLNQIGILLE